MRIGMAICRSTLFWCLAALFSLPSLAQTVTVSPTSISFGNQVQGTASSVHKVTLKNGQSTAITFTSATSNLSDYAATNNCPVSPATLAAGASCTISVTFTPGALGTRNGTLTVKDSGASSPQLVTLTGNGTAPSLVSIAVTPASPSIAVGNTQQFTATGTYNNGTTQNLTTTATWSSSRNSVATIKGTSGLATGVAAGSSTITAKSGSISGSTTLTVTAVVLTSISVTPQNPSVAAGLTQQFTATGTYSNGTTQNLTTTATWTSSNTSVATIKSTTGLATAIASGTSTITAKSGTISGSTMLTVTAPTLVSISVTPTSASVAAGLTQQFTATGTYSNGTTQNLTSTATWSSSAPSVANVNSGGLATSVAKGTANITATSGNISNSAALTVSPAVLTSLSITPANALIAKGTSQQFAATGTFSDGSTQNLTSSVSWSSSSTAVATIATTGLASGAGVGATTITATSGAVSNSTTLNVGQPTLVSLAVTPANASFALGTTLHLTATGTYTDGSTLDLTATVTWTTTNTSIATVSAQGVATSVAVGSTTAKATSGAITGSTTLTITAAVLASIAVTPAIPTIPLGTTQPFTATGTYTDGSTQNITNTVQWSSGSPAVATISNQATTQGLASSISQGSATITAASGSMTGSTTLTVTSAALVSLAVTPATPSIALGTTQQFTATGTFTDGTTQDVTSTATWSSDTTSTATINTAGLAQSKGIGTTTVTAASGTVSSSTTLTVTTAALVSIAITPPTSTIPLGTTQQFTATGTFTDGTAQDLRQTGHWSSTAAGVATISNTASTAGLASTVGRGTTTIGVTSGSVSATATLVVNPAVLASIAITPLNPTIALGANQQFTATGTYTDGSTQDLTSVATWSSSDANVAIVSNSLGSYGLATSSGQGATTITATSNAISSSTSITVGSPALVSIAIAPASASIPLGTSQQFNATGTYTDGSVQDITISVTWASSSPAVAPVSAAGLVTGRLLGSSNISAASGSVTGSTSVTVSAPILVSLSVTPVSASIAKGTTQQFAATGTYSDGSLQDLTTAVNWSSSATSIATIANGGLASGAGVGSATIIAASGALTATATLTVGQPTLVSLAVTPANPSFALGTTLPMIATGTYTDGSTLDLTATATWTTGNASIATVSSQGIAGSVALGSTNVTATSGTIRGSTTLTITPAVLVSIAVTPAIPTIPLGTTAQFTATGTYTDGSTQNITSTVQWSSDAPAVATISNDATTQGLASSFGHGSTTITATSGSTTGSTTLTVTSAALVSLAITPASPSIALGTTQQFIATGTFTDGSTQNLTSTATWTSDTLSIATINNAGLAQSAGIGTTTVTATSGTVSSSTVLTVTSATLVSIAINPPTSTIPLGTTQQFTATGTFTDGTTQDLTPGGHWSSTAASVATISNTAATAGLATALGAGTTTIGISSGSVSAQATLVVSPAVLASIAIAPQNPTIALGTTQQFTATGTYTDGSTQDLTSVVTWSSSAATVAIISNSPGSYGRATSSGQGAATITATSNSISNSTSITVGQATLTSIAVTPSSIAVASGYGVQFTATATYSDGSTQDITQSASWGSSVMAVATVNTSGLASGLMQGTTNISATYLSTSASGVLTVIAPALVSISVTPGSSLVTTGNSVQLTATGLYSDGSTQNVTSSALWSASPSGLATVTAGLLTGISAGTVTVTASAGGITSSGVTVLVGVPADFYVATNGNDFWSGTLFAPNSTNTDGPFATIGKAQSAVQNLLKNSQGRTNAVTVLVRGGSYYGQSLAFSSADSGTSTLAVVWQNYPNEVPIISGGVPLIGWLNAAGNAYQVSLPGSTLYFENLFYNGQRRLRPRIGGYLGTYGRVSASVFMNTSPPPSPAPNPNCSVYVTGKGWECFDRFQANCSDINRAWQNLSPSYPVGDIELVDFELWTDPKLRIQSIDQSCVVYLTGPTTMTLPGHGFIPNHRYLIENVKDALSQPGQWFLDRSTTPWTLTYLANPGENPNSDVVVIPQSPQLLVATNLQYVTFKGLTFQNDNYTVPSSGYASTQQDPNIPAAVACHNCQNVTFDSDTISETSGMGIEFTTTSTTLTTSHNAFQNGALYDIGGTAIRVGKPPASGDTDANVAQFTTIQNNLIEGYGRVFPSGVGIIQGSGHDNTYTHNDIYDGYHSGIEVCLPPACAPGKKSSAGSFNNIASFNHIFNLFEGITDDAGAIYFATGGTTYTPSGNQILNNKIHDLSDASVMDSDGYGGSGIYLDSYTGLVNIQNNLVYRTSGDSVKITSGPQLAGQANTVKNNILAYSRLGGILNNTPYVGTTCPATVPTIFNATNNLFYFDRQSTSTPAYFLQQGCDFTCGASITALHNWQNNLYWRLNGTFDSETKAFHTQPKPGASQLCTLGTNTWTFYTFAGWQALGEDLSSSNNINPGFNAPAYPTDDYSLPNGSPNSFFTVFDPAQAGRTNPLIKPANPSDIPPTFPTQTYNPASDY
jgi:uncharacterized protein YjdB